MAGCLGGGSGLRTEKLNRHLSNQNQALNSGVAAKNIAIGLEDSRIDIRKKYWKKMRDCVTILNHVIPNLKLCVMPMNAIFIELLCW